MVFNLVFANLTANGVSLAPALAPNTLSPLNKIASVVPNAVAGINGGYFYRIGSCLSPFSFDLFLLTSALQITKASLTMSVGAKPWRMRSSPHRFHAQTVAWVIRFSS